MHRPFRKPLIVMSPKSLLRHKLAVSPPAELIEGRFCNVLDECDEVDPAAIRRVVLCSGKIYYELLISRRERDLSSVAIARVEQLYPFPAAELRSVLDRYPAATEVYWVQEEPENMGAWRFISDRLAPILGGRHLRYVGREAAASPAVGSYKLHQEEQNQVINQALRKYHAR
jgi:2-oxoglutarate dehydrogenase E1 component